MLTRYPHTPTKTCITAVALAALAALSACVESELPGTFDDSDMVRTEQVRPPDPSVPDSGFTLDLGTSGMDDDMDTTPDMGGGGPDMPEVCVDACVADSTRCQGDLVEACARAATGCTEWQAPTQCPTQDDVCRANACTAGPSCIDADRDGRGVGCAAGPDCDDNDKLRYDDNVEVCDGVDNDCNGLEDDGIMGVGEACDVGQGECLATGTQRCNMAGELFCDAVPGQPMAETCDGLDNDCNGTPDDGMVCMLPACAQDANEPNDSISGAYMLMRDTPRWGLTCQTDREFFQLDVAPGVTHRLNVAFPHSLSDIDITLYEDGAPLRNATSISDHEIIEFRPLAGRTYVAEIVNLGGNDTFYRVNVTQDWSCSDEDAFGDNSTFNDAALLLSDWRTPVYMCSNTEDWYFLGEVMAGERIDVDAFFTLFFGFGDLDMQLFGDEDGDGTYTSVQTAQTGTRNESLSYTAGATSRFYLRVYPYTASDSNDYDILWTKTP